MNHVQLYIDNRRVDLDKSIVMPVTFQFSDLTNPTAIKNNYSKTISIPSTPNNDEIFTHFWKLDSIVTDFDPSLRVYYTLYNGSSIIDRGYMRLESIDYNKNLPSTYNVNLYGGLGDFFLNLSEKYMTDLNIDPDNYTHAINRQSVINSIDNENNYYKYALTYSGTYDNFDSEKVFNAFSSEDGPQIKDIAFGDGVFMAVFNTGIAKSTNGNEWEIIDEPENFIQNWNRIVYDINENRFIAWNDSTTSGRIAISEDTTGDIWSIRTIATRQIIRDFYVIDYVNNTYSSDPNGVYCWITADNFYSTNYNDFSNVLSIAIPSNTGRGLTVGVSGIYPHSDMALPYYFVSCQTRCYFVERNNSTANPLSITEITPDRQNTSAYGYYLKPVCADTITRENYPYAEVPKYNQVYYTKYLTNPATGWVTLDATEGASNIDGNYFLNQSFIVTSPMWIYYGVPNSNSSLITWTVYKNEYAIRSLSYGNGIYIGITSNVEGNIIIISSTDLQNWSERQGIYSTLTDQQDEHQRNEYRSYYQRPALKLQPLIEQIIADSNYTVNFDSTFTVSPYYTDTWLIMQRLTYTGESPENQAGNIRSGNTITYNDMMTKGITQLDFLIDYCKSFGLIIWFDKIRLEVNIHTRNVFFQNYRILDWNEKVDYSKYSKGKPLPFDFRFGVLRWLDNNTYYEDIYKEKYSREYGYTRVDTGYQFNDNEKNLIDDIVFSNTVISQEWDRFFDGRVEERYRDDKVLPALYVRNNDQMSYNDSSMHIVFYNGLKEVEEFKVSDDNNDMFELSLFMWTDNTGDYTAYENIPLFTKVFQDSEGVIYSLDFGRPSDFYYDSEQLGIPYPGENDNIYARFWKRYINERYNVNNKVLTNYAWLNRIDINEFSHRDFVLIENVNFFVNKIIDYDVNGFITSQLELQRVSDISAYLEGQFPTGEYEGSIGENYLRLSRNYYTCGYLGISFTLEIIGGTGNFTINEDLTPFYTYEINDRTVTINIPVNNNTTSRVGVFTVKDNHTLQVVSCTISQSEQGNTTPPGASYLYFKENFTNLAPHELSANNELTSSHNWNLI